jgi:hypothetical protein
MHWEDVELWIQQQTDDNIWSELTMNVRDEYVKYHDRDEYVKYHDSFDVNGKGLQLYVECISNRGNTD